VDARTSCLAFAVMQEHVQFVMRNCVWRGCGGVLLVQYYTYYQKSLLLNFFFHPATFAAVRIFSLRIAMKHSKRDKRVGYSYRKKLSHHGIIYDLLQRRICRHKRRITFH
jgi:hypothetical protein